MLALAWVAGTCIDRWAALPPALPLALSGLALALAIFSRVALRRVLPVHSLLLLAASFLAMSAHGQDLRGPLPPDHVLHREGERVSLIARVHSGPRQARENRRRYLLEIDWLRPSPRASWEAASGRVQLTLGAPPDVELLPGDRVLLGARVRKPRGFGNPGCMDYAALLAARGARATAYVELPDAVVLLERGPWAGRLLGRLRLQVGRLLDQEIPAGARRELVRALTLGDAGAIPLDVRQDLAATGTAHLLALSGLHLAVVAGLIYALLSWLLRRCTALLLRVELDRLVSACTLLAILAYTLLTGAQLPTVRAAVMVGVYLGARVVGRSRDLASAYALALLLLLLRHPRSLFNPSFQLSFAAVAAVLLVTPRLLSPFRRLEAFGRSGGPLRRIPWRIAQALSVSLAASLGTWPIIALHFHQLAALAPLANLLVVPLVSFLLLPLAMSLLLLAPICPWLAGLCAWAAGWIASWVGELAALLARLPGAGLQVPPPRSWELLLYLLAALGLLFAKKPRLRIGLGLGAGLALVLVVALTPLGSRLDSGLEMRFLDVGQGDSALLRLPGPFFVLVDAGGNDGTRPTRIAEQAILPYLRWARVERIDLLVLTHPHPDHYLGAAGLLAAMPVGEVWIPAGDDSDGGEAWARFLEEEVVGREIPLHRKDNRSKPLRRGDVLLEVLHPPPGGGGFRGNDRSLVVSLRLGSRGVLLTGDLERGGEQYLLDLLSPARLAHDLLKVGHHGSRTSSSAAFLDAVRPAQAFFSLGHGNRYGFPHPEVLERCQERDIHTWQADQNGSLWVRIEPSGSMEAVAWGSR